MKLFLFLLTLLPLPAAPFQWQDHYAFVDIPAPPGIDCQVGGMDLTPKGELMVCLHRGEVMTFHEDTETWSTFATGLLEPLGLLVEDEHTVLVVQRSELTRLHDENKDGTADFYETVCDDWGMSGNYHEFAFGLVKDTKGNVFLSLGTASNGAGAREEIRGPWNNTGGLTHDKFLSGGERGSWGGIRSKEGIPRMYARVPYRGCILKIAPGSRKAEVYATGTRTPNGLYMDANDQLWVSDNQGDWLGASKLFRIKEGGFHGHPASLLWTKNPPKVTPATIPPAKLDALRTRAAALTPQGDCGNSLTQMLPFPENGRFLPADLSGQLVIGEMNHARLVRYLPDVVGGVHQGTSTHLLDTPSTVLGNNRLLFSKKGNALFIGKTHLSWAGYQGIKKIIYKGSPFLLADSVKMIPTGFQFTFNEKITSPVDLNKCSINSYELAYHAKYGSPKINEKKHAIKSMILKDRTLTLHLKEKLEPNRVYDIQLSPGISSEIGPLSNSRFWYTAHVVAEPAAQASN